MKNRVDVHETRDLTSVSQIGNAITGIRPSTDARYSFVCDKRKRHDRSHAVSIVLSYAPAKGGGFLTAYDRAVM